MGKYTKTDILRERQKRKPVIKKVLGIKFHRNGVSGAGFHAVKFIDGDNKEMIASVFEKADHVSVICPEDGIEACWRGDYYAVALRKAIVKHNKELYGD